MALSLAAIVPHSPLLISRIGGERTTSLGPTLHALADLAGELAQARIETLVVVGDHGSLRHDRLTLVLSPELKLQLKQFGDVSTARSWATDVALANALREYGETNLPLAAVAPEELGYAVGIPLSFMSEYAPKLKVVCLGPALLPAQDHLNLGAAIRHVAEQTTAKVAIAVAGDVPEGSPEFVQAVTQALAGRLQSLQDARWADSPQALAWRATLTLLGATSDAAWNPDVLADQRVFETGLLTAILRQ